MTSTQNELFELLDRAKYLFLREISEPDENWLRLVVEEGAADRSQTIRRQDPTGSLAEILRGAAPVTKFEGSKTFELRWSGYVGYLVTDEVAGSSGSHEGEVYSGRLFRVYTKSHFLDHLARDTGNHVLPVRHFKLVCQNHLIDVGSYNLPEIRLLKSEPIDQ